MSGEGVRIVDQPSQLECMAVGPVVKLPYYGDADEPKVRFGDRVFVDDPYWAQFRGMPFRFVATAYNVESGVTWIELNGGPPGKVWTRAFTPTSVRVPVKKR